MFNVTDKSAPFHYGPAQTALLLLDFHTLFVQKAGGPGAPTALEVAVKMREWAGSQGIQVIHGLIDINGSPPPTCKDADMFANIFAAMRSSGGEEDARLLNGSGDDVTFIRRPGYVSALKSDHLNEFLHNKGIRSLILTGLSTSGCVMRTASAASDAEFVVTVISDGCADPTEGLHDLLVQTVLTHREYVITAAGFQEGFAEAGLRG